MNYSEIKSAIKHLLKTLKCTSCKGKFEEEDINIIATTKNEGLFEVKCPACAASSILTVMLSPEIEVKEGAAGEEIPNPIAGTQRRLHRGISHNDVLDMKNFLGKFDGNFKKLFINKTEEHE